MPPSHFRPDAMDIRTLAVGRAASYPREIHENDRISLSPPLLIELRTTNREFLVENWKFRWMDCYSKIYDWDILFEANFNIRIDQFITFRIVERNVGVVDVTRNSCIKYKYVDNEYNRILVRLLFKYWDWDYCSSYKAKLIYKEIRVIKYKYIECNRILVNRLLLKYYDSWSFLFKAKINLLKSYH